MSTSSERKAVSLGERWRREATRDIDDQRLAVCVAQEQTFFGALGGIHQNRRIGIAAEIIQIDLARFHDQNSVSYCAHDG